MRASPVGAGKLERGVAVEFYLCDCFAGCVVATFSVSVSVSLYVCVCVALPLERWAGVHAIQQQHWLLLQEFTEHNFIPVNEGGQFEIYCCV